jgi:hypothetical protein
MSPRAALRLERLGFGRVYDYVAGKADWMAFWLPWEGDAHLAGAAMRTEVPTCGFLEPARAVGERLAASDGGFLVALNDDGVVMGLLTEIREAAGDATVEDVMIVGPTTVRPSEPLEAITGRMARHHVDAVLVTNSDGKLLGLLDRREAEAALQNRASTDD